MLDLNQRQMNILNKMLSSSNASFTRKDFTGLHVSDKTLIRDVYQGGIIATLG